MKIKHLILGLGAGWSVLTGCNDEMGTVGPSIQPPEDKISVYNDTFKIEMSTVLMGGVYANSDSALLGEIYDPLYGNLKSDYMCQFYCPDGFRFKHTPEGGQIDSVDFRVYYDTSIGDTLVPMQAEIFRVTQPLQQNYYTNFDPQEYSDMQKSLGKQTYTAYDQSVPDSIRNDYYFSPNVKIRMPNSFGQAFYDETIDNPATFANQETFNRFFPGLYVTTTFGTGNVLKIYQSALTIHYHYIVKGSQDQDSSVYAAERFTVTEEVIQLSRFKNTELEPLLRPSDAETYIKSPAGVCTRIVLPMEEIIPVVKGRILNNMPLTLKTFPQEDWKFAFQPVPYLLVLPEDSVKSFFENGNIENSVTSYLSSSYTGVNQGYVFGNLSNLINYQIEHNAEKDLALWAIPVSRTTMTNGYNQAQTVSISNYMSPAGVKLRKDEEARTIVITSAQYDH